MRRNHIWRTLIIYGAILIALFYLYPTYRYYQLSSEEKQEMRENPERKPTLDHWQDNSIHLGLDLQGGMHIVLEVAEQVQKADDTEDLSEKVNRALEIIRNRIDEFGVSEPIVQKQGSKRILIQLPGVEDPGRAKDIIEKNAFLEFKLLRDNQETAKLLEDINDIVLNEMLADSAAAVDTTIDENKRPFLSKLMGTQGGIMIEADNLPYVRSVLEKPEVQKLFNADAQKPIQYHFGQKVEDEQNNTYYRSIYFTNKNPELTGDAIINARVEFSGMNEPEVGFDLNASGAKKFAEITGSNINKRMAIVLDGVVASAPNIQGRIPNGKSRITGSFGLEEAKDLALVLRAGALPVALELVEERTVGATLGEDSIRMGVKAGLYGMIVVIIFMIIYYRLSGFVAIIALFLNMLFVMAALAGFGAVLTLPGIAGLILTIGMSVDANVLIFERVREEILKGKPIRSSVDSGYDKAFRTIMDANLTTLITALVLYQYGTGPIRGFAVTLSIGIVSSMFTAIVVTRGIFDFFIDKIKVKKLSI